MARQKTVYGIEVHDVGSETYLPLKDASNRDPVTFTGRGSKVQAFAFAKMLVRWTERHGVYRKIRVVRNGEVVWQWAKPAGEGRLG